MSRNINSKIFTRSVAIRYGKSTVHCYRARVRQADVNEGKIHPMSIYSHCVSAIYIEECMSGELSFNDCLISLEYFPTNKQKYEQ
jgi:hypothetical protein